MVLAAILLLCAAAMITVYALNCPQKETICPVHTLPEYFEEAAKLDINTADMEELDRLPGVGEMLSQRIIAYREANGGFESVEEIMLVEGIGESLFAGMRDMITAGGTEIP